MTGRLSDVTLRLAPGRLPCAASGTPRLELVLYLLESHLHQAAGA